MYILIGALTRGAHIEIILVNLPKTELLDLLESSAFRVTLLIGKSS